MSQSTIRVPEPHQKSELSAMPLADLHRHLGARFEPYRGVDSPAFYSSRKEEYEGLRHGCALVDRSWVSRLEMVGEDRVRFLNGLVTCDVKGLEVGQTVYGFVTNPKGRILADVGVAALDDRLWLELAPGTGEQIASHLSKYVIIDRVEILRLDRIPLSLYGPRAGEFLAGLTTLPEERRHHHQVEICGTAARLVCEPDVGAATYSLWAPTADAGALFEELLRQGAELDLRPVGHHAIERLRIEESRSLFGRDFGPDNFPQETGIPNAVSYDKGCYLGQEVVARIHYRGGVNRHLRGLIFTGERDAEEIVGRRVLVEGREAGIVTSASESGDRCLGLAMLHKRAEPGARVEVEGYLTAKVVALPFAAA